MDRRRFLSLLAVGAPAAIVAPKLGLLERVRSYFFAPSGGWRKNGELWLSIDWGYQYGIPVGYTYEMLVLVPMFQPVVEMAKLPGIEMFQRESNDPGWINLARGGPSEEYVTVTVPKDFPHRSGLVARDSHAL